MNETDLATAFRENVVNMFTYLNGDGEIFLQLDGDTREDNGMPYVRHTYQVSGAEVVGVGTETKMVKKTGRVYLELFFPLGRGEAHARELATALEHEYTARDFGPQIEIGEPHTTRRYDNDWFVLVVSVPFRAYMFR